MALSMLGFGYAAVVAAGGVVGYVKAGSGISLAMGLLFGGISAFGSYQIHQNPKNVTLLLVSSAILTGIMGYRFINSGKFMPAGLVCGLSLVVVIGTGLTMLQK